MIRLVKSEGTLGHDWPYLVYENAADQVLVFSRGDLLFLFNFNPSRSFTDYGFNLEAGKFRIALDTDLRDYGGQGRVDGNLTYYTLGDGRGGRMLKCYIPSRSALVFKRLPIPRVH
jgi:1,4-alpha-glucan branching enzyme